MKKIYTYLFLFFLMSNCFAGDNFLFELGEYNSYFSLCSYKLTLSKQNNQIIRGGIFLDGDKYQYVKDNMNKLTKTILTDDGYLFSLIISDDKYNIVCETYFVKDLYYKKCEYLPYRRYKEDSIISYLISTDGKIIFYNKENAIDYFSEDKFIIKNIKYDKIYGILDRNFYLLKTLNAEYVFLTTYDNYKSVEDEEMLYAKIQNENNFGFISKDGAISLEPIFSKIDNFSESGYAKVYKDSLIGLIDKNGRIVINPEYQEIGEFSEGLCKIKKNNKWGYVNQKGETIINCQYDKARDFNEGLAAFSIDGSVWGFINKNGEIIIKPIFYGVLSGFNNKKAIVYKDPPIDLVPSGRVVIDMSGNILGKTKYNLFTDYNKIGIAVFFEYYSELGCIDKFDNVLIEPKYQDITLNDDGLILVEDSECNRGIYNNKGKIVAECIYDSIERINNKYYLIKTENKLFGIAGIDGIVIQPEYNIIRYDSIKNIFLLINNEYAIIFDIVQGVLSKNPLSNDIKKIFRNYDEYEAISFDINNIIYYDENNGFGVYNHKKSKIIISPDKKYSNNIFLNKSFIFLSHYGIYDNEGNLIFQ